jgi:CRP/FNR family cyclic AMP-dependent transcriptional regulator
MRTMDHTVPEPSWLAPLLSYCHCHQYPAGKDLIKPGDAADSLLYVLDGQVTVILVDEEGKEIILAYLSRGDFIGEMGLFAPQPKRSVCIRARSKCELAEITYSKLELLLDNDLKDQARPLLYDLGRQLSDRLTKTSRKVSDLAFLDVTGRVASALLDLSRQPGVVRHPKGMQIRITRQEISRIVGCSREMVGRVLKGMEEEGLITTKGKTMVIFDAR